jgi:hypothetical protein
MGSDCGIHDATFQQNSKLFGFTLIGINSVNFNLCVLFLELEALTICCKAINSKNYFVKSDDIYTVKLGHRGLCHSDNLATVCNSELYYLQ